MVWSRPHEPKGFLEEVKAACGGLRRHANLLERRARHPNTKRADARPDMIQARLRAARVLRAMADFGEARLFEEFEETPPQPVYVLEKRAKFWRLRREDHVYGIKRALRREEVLAWGQERGLVIKEDGL